MRRLRSPKISPMNNTRCLAAILLLVSSILVAATSSTAQTIDLPSFDCSAKLSTTEGAICANPKLTKADATLNVAYKTSLATISDHADVAGLQQQQREFLRDRDLCKVNVLCIEFAYAKRQAQLKKYAEKVAPPLSAKNISAAAVAQDPADEIAFVFDNPIDGYEVSGVWFPIGLHNDVLLMGPAFFQLRNVSSGQIIKISENAVSLLDESFDDGLKTDANIIAKLKSQHPLHLKYGEQDRAQKVTCEDSKDACLKLGNIPIDLQDIDFDGTPEVVIRQRSAGQRGVSTFAVYNLDFKNSSHEEALGAWPYEYIYDHKVFKEIDELSVINLTKEEIHINGSNGACHDTEEVYVVKGDSGYKSLSLSEFQTMHFENDSSEICIRDIYRVERSEDGVVKYMLTSSTKSK